MSKEDKVLLKDFLLCMVVGLPITLAALGLIWVCSIYPKLLLLPVTLVIPVVVGVAFAIVGRIYFNILGRR